ncbi:MAG: pyridoxal phosphate-dependent aminotransferase [Bryobacteraceae bacterium]|nr:pyridoxal phosphate-dependent aminotransferase [Bryobacteraceae bacterium]
MRTASLKPTAVNSILAEVRELQARGADLVSLMRGEPDLPTPPHIVEACVSALRKGRTGYPDNRGEKSLREAVAAKLAAVNGLTYDPGTEILVTTGATFGIYAALMALLGEGEDVLLPDPIYDAYQSPIRLAGGNPVPVPSCLENGRFRLESEALERAWTPSTRVLLLNTPWNPTGTVFTAGELSGIAAFCKQYSVTLISDEIYEAITYDGAQHVSPLAVAPELRERCVLVNALSKTYSMTGWRVGYCAGPAHLIQRMFLILQQSSRGPATFVQDAAAVALTGPQDCVRQMQAEYAARRHKVIDALSGIDCVRVIAPEGGFFAMVDVRGLGRNSGQIRRRLMDDYGVVVVHGAAYGEGGEGTLRVSFGSGGGTLSRGLERLAAGLRHI